jgi:hypothetical protein
MSKPQAYAVALDGTNPQFLVFQDLLAVEVIPGGTITVQMRLGDGVDDVPLTSGASYVSPTDIPLAGFRLRLMAASATTVSVIAWP